MSESPRARAGIAVLLLGASACGSTDGEPSDVAGADGAGASGLAASSSGTSAGQGGAGAGASGASTGVGGSGGGAGGAVSHVVKGYGDSGSKSQATSVTSPTYTFAANSVAIASLAQKRDDGISNDNPTLSTPGLSWTWLQKACMNWSPPAEPCSVGNARRLDIFMAIVGPTEVTAATTFTATEGQVTSGLWWNLTEWSGVDAVNPIRQNISMAHPGWSPRVSMDFLDVAWENPPYSVRTNLPVQPGNMGVAFHVASENSTLHGDPGVTDILADDTNLYLHQRVVGIAPGYSSETIGHFAGVDPEPAVCDGRARSSREQQQAARGRMMPASRSRPACASSGHY